MIKVFFVMLSFLSGYFGNENIITVSISLADNSDNVLLVEFTNNSEFTPCIDQRLLLENGNMFGDSFKLWDGYKFAQYIGGHDHNKESVIKCFEPYQSYNVQITLSNFYLLEKDKTYEVYYKEDATKISIGEQIYINPLISQKVSMKN